MSIHSKFLVHWTGNGKDDIESQSQSASEKRRLYLGRLVDYYQDGLYAKRTKEDTIRRKKMVDLMRLCFTEIRLSQVEKHAKRYGKLGIGFTRDFIMNKGGRPVIYIPFKTEADGRLLEDSIKNVFERSEGDIYRLEFKASDIKLIIFPDEKTKQMSLKDDAIAKYFSKHMPVMATLKDCRNF